MATGWLAGWVGGWKEGHVHVGLLCMSHAHTLCQASLSPRALSPLSRPAREASELAIEYWKKEMGTERYGI